MRKFEIIKKYINEIREDFKMPCRSTKASAGYDIFNNTGEEIVLNPGEISKPVTTYLKALFPDNEVLQIYPRSSHGFKYSLKLVNSVAIIDADYALAENEGEIFLKFHNQSPNKRLEIGSGEAMAQAIFTTYLTTDNDDKTVGGLRTGGIGSTT
jgi:dUTP pyrophosphatase